MGQKNTKKRHNALRVEYILCSREIATPNTGGITKIKNINPHTFTLND